MKFISSFAAALLISAMPGGHAHAADPGCIPISYLPFVITSAGTYCTTAYLYTSQSTGPAIEIQADNVVLDFSY